MSKSLPIKSVELEGPRWCDVCAAQHAVVDAPTKMGPWAYLCPSCYEYFGTDSAAAVGCKITWPEPIKVTTN